MEKFNISKFGDSYLGESEEKAHILIAEFSPTVCISGEEYGIKNIHFFEELGFVYSLSYIIAIPLDVIEHVLIQFNKKSSPIKVTISKYLNSDYTNIIVTDSTLLDKINHKKMELRKEMIDKLCDSIC